MPKIEPKEKVNAITPENRELIECVMKAVCNYFDVTEKQLKEEHKLATARHYCFYLIKENTTGVFDYNIGAFFNRKRTAVQYGIDLVDHHKFIYRQTLGTLNTIIQIANNFEKKYTWDLQPINITH